ncbi:MAG: hypothetical protein ACKVU4_00610 [Phycisphaerales bacterium]
MANTLDLLFTGGAQWFAVPAILGTLVFLIRLVLMLVGVSGLDLDIDHGGGDLHHGDPGDAFKFLSIQSLFAFAMGFGWAGLAAYRGQHWEMGLSLIVACAGGAAMVWFLAMLLKGIHDLQSSGNINIASAAGHEGDVYATVPARRAGRGQVRVVVQQRQRTYNAVTEGDELATGTRVKITRVNEDNTLTVARA